MILREGREIEIERERERERRVKQRETEGEIVRKRKNQEERESGKKKEIATHIQSPFISLYLALPFFLCLSFPF